MKTKKLPKKPIYTYADMAAYAGTTKQKMQAFCRAERARRAAEGRPAFAVPSAQVIIGKAKADAFDAFTATAIGVAWSTTGPGRKK
jgi:hypothetical protein